MNKRWFLSLLVVSLALLPFMSGCRDSMPHSMTWPYSGDTVQSHPEPPEGGYYTNWDPYAVELEVSPVTDVNPVRTQHVFIATVKDADGKPLPNRRVEWIIAEGSVGDIVEVDESGWRASRGYIMDNERAVSHTNNGEHVLTMGNSDPSDDIPLGVGQTWCVITSPIEGTTHLIAYAPGIHDWDKHKVFVTKHWLDFGYEFPGDATNRIGASHAMGTHVFKNSDGTPLAGYEVTYTIVSGPAATLSPGGGQTATVKTDANGMANVTLNQKTPMAGANVVDMAVVRPAMDGQDELTLANGSMTKTWLAPAIKITKNGPATGFVDEPLTYTIVVSNPGQVAANNVVVTDVLPAGLTFIEAMPEAQVRGSTLTWNFGSMAPGASKSITLKAKATKMGTFVNPADVKADDGLADKDDATTVIAAAALTVEKTAPAEVMICEMIDYVIVVKNTGTAPATNVVIEESLPEGLLTESGKSRVTSNIASLAPGESRKVSFQAKASKTGTFRNTVVVKADRGIEESDAASTKVTQPVLEITKKAPASRYLDQSISYAITIKNTGDADALGTTMVDTLPAGVAFVSADNGGKMAGGKVTWDLGTLKQGASQTVNVVIRADKIGTLRNSVRATAKCAEGSASSVTEVTGIPALRLECVDLTDPIAIGKEVTYVITVKNQGTAKATGVVIKCTLPAEETFVSATGPTADTVNGQVVTFGAVAMLEPQAEATYKVTVKGTKAGDVRFTVALEANELDNSVNETESTRFYDAD